ncbi:MAG: histidinol-phosphate transaminase [Flavipsychrobacter sp.]|nr:histidinol-phosphate transaminase [Flavipsychrobacter sp.]
MKQFDLQKIIRENILKLVPYSSARSEFKAEAQVFLDANENSMASAWNEYSRYPDPLQLKLKERISELKGIDTKNIFLGNGSDEPIDLLIRATCRPGVDNLIAISPSYGMYKVAADINDVEVKEVLLNSFYQPIIADIMAAADSNSKLLFLCSPNNPTGNSIKPSIIEELANSFKGIVIIDEAYIDFADVSSSWISKIADYPNVVVLQTFSKAWGLAALRMGMAFASEDIIAILNKIKAPYNISLPAQQLALAALQDTAVVANAVSIIKAQRVQLINSLLQYPFVQKVHPSDANFLLTEVTDANALYKYLLTRKIVVRNRTNVPLCTNCVRITVGTPEENQFLLQALNEYTA